MSKKSLGGELLDPNLLALLVEHFRALRYVMDDAGCAATEAARRVKALNNTLGTLRQDLYWQRIPRRIAFWILGTLTVVVAGCAMSYAVELDAGLLETLRQWKEWGAR